MSGHVLSPEGSSSSLFEGINIDPETPLDVQSDHLIMEPDKNASGGGRQNMFQRTPDPMQRLMKVVGRGVLGEGWPKELNDLITVEPVTGGKRKNFEEAPGFPETPC